MFSKPNGEPIATTHSPTLSCSGSPSFTVGRFFASILSTATSVRVSAPTTFALNSRRSVSFTRHFVGVGDDVRVGEDVAVGADDEARADTLRARIALRAAARQRAKRRKNS